MDINKLSIQERFYIFLALFCMGIMVMNYYFQVKIDRDIQQRLEEINKISKENFTANAIARSMAIEHWKSMYNAQKNYSELVEQQVDVVNEHWKKEYIKVSDELFDLKYTTNAVSK
tara:strand:- start:19 stop:366 length:348 start_codon:yes stop_codon:yes gene_type:complete